MRRDRHRHAPHKRGTCATHKRRPLYGRRNPSKNEQARAGQHVLGIVTLLHLEEGTTGSPPSGCRYFRINISQYKTLFEPSPLSPPPRAGRPALSPPPPPPTFEPLPSTLLF